MGNDNYKQGSDFFMTFSGKKRRVFWTFQQKVSKIPLQYHSIPRCHLNICITNLEKVESSEYQEYFPLYSWP